MIRIAATVAAIVLVIGGAVYVGMRWDDAGDEKKRADTLERIDDADTSKGDADADRSWVADFVKRLSE